MKPATLGDYLDASAQATKTTVEAALRDALRAQELQDVPVFQWWRQRIEKEIKKFYRKLAYADGAMEQFHRRRGMIQGIEHIFRALDELSGHVGLLEDRLKEYRNDRKQA